jgi:hypothetical protein
MPTRYFFYLAVIEGLVLSPVAIAGIGHAGPNGGILALISFLLNLPGIICVMWLSQFWDFPWPRFIVAVFAVQTLLLWLFGLLVVWLRRARAKA